MFFQYNYQQVKELEEAQTKLKLTIEFLWNTKQ